MSTTFGKSQHCLISAICKHVCCIANKIYVKKIFLLCTIGFYVWNIVLLRFFYYTFWVSRFDASLIINLSFFFLLCFQASHVQIGNLMLSFWCFIEICRAANGDWVALVSKGSRNENLFLKCLRHLNYFFLKTRNRGLKNQKL